MTEYQAIAKARRAFYEIMEALGEHKAEQIFRQVAEEPGDAHYGSAGPKPR